MGNRFQSDSQFSQTGNSSPGCKGTTQDARGFNSTAVLLDMEDIEGFATRESERVDFDEEDKVGSSSESATGGPNRSGGLCQRCLNLYTTKQQMAEATKNKEIKMMIKVYGGG